MITDVQTEIAWLAGIIEGEGTFVWNGGKKKVPSMLVASTDLDVVEKIRDLVCPDRDIKTYRLNEKNCKPIHRISITKRVVLEELLEKIRPYMCERRGKRIDEFLTWYENNPPQRIWR